MEQYIDEDDAAAAADSPPLPLTVPSSPASVSAQSPTPAGQVFTPTASYTRSEPVAQLPNRTNKRIRDSTEEVLNLAFKKLSSFSETAESDVYVLMDQMIALDLKDMQEMQRKLAKKLIFDVIHMGSMDQLTEKHHVICKDGSNS